MRKTFLIVVVSFCVSICLLAVSTVGAQRTLDEELAHQAEADQKQTNPLAHPLMIIGNPQDNSEWISSRSVENYIAAYGEEFPAQPLPPQYEFMEPNSCYRNAAFLVTTDPRLTYAEGFASSSDTPGKAFMHAWAVDQFGNVVDPTWRTQKDPKYFGVKYNREAFLRFIDRNQSFGIITTVEIDKAMRVIETGGEDIR